MLRCPNLDFLVYLSTAYNNQIECFKKQFKIIFMSEIKYVPYVTCYNKDNKITLSSLHNIETLSKNWRL